MYLKRVEVDSVKSLDKAELAWASGSEPGWHVILGDNGRGKSTLLRAISLALLGPSAVDFLRLPIGTWVTEGKTLSTVTAELAFDETYDPLNQRGRYRTIPPIHYEISPKGMMWQDNAKRFEGNLWGQAALGWFSVGFGPFRRFTGGAEAMTKFYYSHPRFGRHLSLHGEDVALTEVVTWLKELHYRAVSSPSGPAGALLAGIAKLVNGQALLPDGAQLTEINPDGVFFSTSTTNRIPMENLSDGFRSILSMVLEIVRQAMASTDRPEELFLENHAMGIHGVVLIDEIDVHLHPIWQATVGEALTRVFPSIQFLVTTHSPLICQAAKTIWKLDDGESGVVGLQTTEQEFQVLRYGTVQEAYGLTSAFGSVREQAPDGLQREVNLAKSGYSVADLASLVSEKRTK